MKKIRCGLRIGNSFLDATNYSYPLAEILFAQQGINIIANCLWVKKSYIIPYHEIVQISFQKGWWFRGYLLEHTSDDAPTYILLWIWNRNKVMELCKQYSIRYKA